MHPVKKGNNPYQDNTFAFGFKTMTKVPGHKDMYVALNQLLFQDFGRGDYNHVTCMSKKLEGMPHIRVWINEIWCQRQFSSFVYLESMHDIILQKRYSNYL